MSNQLAVLFPGIGYHIDKPLLYYSAKLARARGCDLLAVQYPALPTGLRGRTVCCSAQHSSAAGILHAD